MIDNLSVAAGDVAFIPHTFSSYNLHNDPQFVVVLDVSMVEERISELFTGAFVLTVSGEITRVWNCRFEKCDIL